MICPFYGYHAVPLERLMLSSGGKQCALRDGYAPCMLEIDGKPPELEHCTFNGTGRALAFAQFERRPFATHRAYPD